MLELQNLYSIFSNTANVHSKECRKAAPGRNSTPPFAFLGKINTTNLAPLNADTVSFTGKGRTKAPLECSPEDDSIQKRSSKNLDKSQMGSLKVANDILKEEDVEFAFNRFMSDISSIFGIEAIDFTDKKDKRLKAEHKEQYRKMVAENIEKNSPILAITGRKKEAASIKEKMGSKHITTKKDAKKKITDIIGMRIVLSGTSKDAGNYVIGKLTKAVEDGKIKIVEIENYNNSEFKYPTKYQYASGSKLEKLAATARNHGVKDFKYYTKQNDSGYTAIHLLLEFPGGIKGELQIAGLDVLRLKDVEDLCYKALTNKALPHKYKEIQELFGSLEDDATKYSAFMDYTRKAYAHERTKEPHSYSENQEFLSIPEDSKLAEEYDFNNIAKLKKHIDAKENLLLVS